MPEEQLDPERLSQRLGERLAAVRRGIAAACDRAGRDQNAVTLIAASKFVPAEIVRRAYALGVKDFGENYVRELRDKREAAEAARWHYLGALQSSGVHLIAELADVVHGMEPGRAGERLASRASGAGREIPVLIQVDFTGVRAGIAPEGVPGFADRISGMAGLRPAGLMTLPPMPDDAEESRLWFRRLRELRDDLLERFPTAMELSMGMSLDYEVAVEEGATMVRVGTALFGERTPALEKPRRPS